MQDQNKSHNDYELANKKAPQFLKGLWRLGRASQRTIFWYDVTIGTTTKKKVKKTFRNPLIQAKEMALEMELNNPTKADLSRKLAISRARVTQILNLLKLPEEMKDEIEGRLVTERMLKSKVIQAVDIENSSPWV